MITEVPCRPDPTIPPLLQRPFGVTTSACRNLPLLFLVFGRPSRVLRGLPHRNSADRTAGIVLFPATCLRTCTARAPCTLPALISNGPGEQYLTSFIVVPQLSAYSCAANSKTQYGTRAKWLIGQALSGSAGRLVALTPSLTSLHALYHTPSGAY